MAMITDGKMPIPKQPPPQQQQRSTNAGKPATPVNHPAVASYVDEWNKMARELDQLRTENHQLKYDLDCARHLINELQHIGDQERAKKESFQRWAVKFDTMAGEIASLAGHLRDEAARAAQPEPTAAQIEGETAPASLEELEQQSAAAMAKKLAPLQAG